MKLYKLIEGINCTYTDKVENFDVEKITTELNETSKSTLYVLIKSVRENSKKPFDKINSSILGAVICNSEDAQYITQKKIIVEDARLALSYLYSAYYDIDYSQTKFIAVTGTNGKTTTATMIYEILLKSNRTAGFIGTGRIEYMRESFTEKSYSMTTPDPSLLYKSIKEMQERGCRYVVMEVSSHAIALEKTAPIPFEIGIFTNLSPEHLDFHKDIESYYLTKLKLFRNVKHGIFNVDDEYSRRALSEIKCKCTNSCIGIIWPADAYARDIILDGFGGSSYFYKDEKRIFKVSISPVGYYNVYNSLFAISASIKLGIPPYLVKEAISNIKTIDGRFEIIRSDIYAIIDYAHTPNAFENVLKTVNSIKKTWQNIITVFGCGGERDVQKRPEMGRIAEKYSSHVIVTEDNSRDELTSKIIADILSGMSDISKRTVITSREEAIRRAVLSSSVDDIVLVLGKGHERYKISNDGITDYNEKEIILSALEMRLNKKHEN